jgi:hypothetical protein
MGTHPLQLLQRLGGSASVASLSAHPPVGDAGHFAALLQGARRGELEGSAPVQIGRDVPVRLDSQQLQRLSVAADRAQAQGMDAALMLIDGQVLKMDVGTRTITQRLDGASTLAADIDGVVTVPPLSLGVVAGESGAQAEQLRSATDLLRSLGRKTA